MKDKLLEKMKEIYSDEDSLSMALDAFEKDQSDENIGRVQSCLSDLEHLYGEAYEITNG